MFQATPSPGTVVFAAGGTAGHVYPALAMAESLRSSHRDVEIVFVGATKGLEADLVRREGLRFVGLPAVPYHRTRFFDRLSVPWSVMKCFFQARSLLQETHAGLVVGFGGFVTVGMFLAARSLGVPIVMHEANVMPGLANRVFSGIAAQIFLGWKQAFHAFPPAHTQVVGLPVRSSILRAGKEPRSVPRPEQQPFRLLITGGSEGSPFLNRHVPSLVAALVRRGLAMEVLHQRGYQHSDITEGAYRRLSIEATVVPYIDDMAEAYSWADFAITCAGAGTLSELAVMGLPALLVPLSSASDDHQTANAQAAAEAGALWWTSESQWNSEQLAARLARLSRDQRQWLDLSESMRTLAHYGAAEHMLDYCVRTLNSKKEYIAATQ